MRARAAVLSSRAPALISHRSAAYLHGLAGDVVPGRIDVTIPRHRRPRRRPGLAFHESLAYDLADPVVRDLIPVTGVARTVLDCCAVIDDPAVRLHLYDEARRLGKASRDDFWTCLLLHAVRGRQGIGPFRSILLERDDETPPDSVFVRRAALVLEAAELPRPVFDYEICACGHVYRLDIAWPWLKVAAECDGKLGHRGEKAWEDDPVRRNRIRLEGWLLLEITWQRLIRDPAGFVAEAGQALASRAA